MNDTELLSLPQLRMALADARVDLRRTTERHKRVQAEREVGILTGLYGGEPKNMGANQADRDRQMILDLTADAEYQYWADALFVASATVTRLEAEVEGLLDERRERERATRDKLADALLAVAAASAVSVENGHVTVDFDSLLAQEAAIAAVGEANHE